MIKTWYELINSKFTKDSCFVNQNSKIVRLDSWHKLGCEDSSTFKEYDKNVFINEAYAKSSLAMSQISQLMPYYGGVITNDEWCDGNLFKYTIERYKNIPNFDGTYTMYTLLAFHTEKQRDSFYDNNKELVDDYLMIDNDD